MKHFRDQDIVHRDIKPGNIMKFIYDDGRYVLCEKRENMNQKYMWALRRDSHVNSLFLLDVKWPIKKESFSLHWTFQKLIKARIIPCKCKYIEAFSLIYQGVKEFHILARICVLVKLWFQSFQTSNHIIIIIYSRRINDDDLPTSETLKCTVKVN